jgi:hypothetical protein
MSSVASLPPWNSKCDTSRRHAFDGRHQGGASRNCANAARCGCQRSGLVCRIRSSSSGKLVPCDSLSSARAFIMFTLCDVGLRRARHPSASPEQVTAASTQRPSSANASCSLPEPVYMTAFAHFYINILSISPTSDRIIVNCSVIRGIYFSLRQVSVKASLCFQRLKTLLQVLHFRIPAATQLLRARITQKTRSAEGQGRTAGQEDNTRALGQQAKAPR